jgi:hypothetical protein
MEQSLQYDGLTDQKLKLFLDNPEQLSFDGKNVKFHVNKAAHD